MIVLYSSERNSWKIGDFGITVRGTSKNPITTNEAKGTACYRAPEILKTVKGKTKYNNKVDIWAIGCIVYELTMEKQAFNSDIDTFEWKDQEKRIPTDVVLDTAPRELISKIIRKSLRAEPKERSTAKNICDWLREYLGLSPVESNRLPPISETSSLLHDTFASSGR